MIYKIELSLIAKQDFIDSLAYTRQIYGDRQCDQYGDLISQAFDMIAANPDIGHSRPDMPPIYRALGCGKHIVVYRAKENIVFIARILHGHKDFKSQL